MPASVMADLEKSAPGSKIKSDQEFLEKDITNTLKQIESLEQLISTKLKPRLDNLPDISGQLVKIEEQGTNNYLHNN